MVSFDYGTDPVYIPGSIRRVMLNKTEKLKLVDRILASKEFSSSKVYQSYLTYLVHATEEGKSPKEITIAIDVFGKNAAFNPAEDTIVRSHTYTLRKKLDTYYYNEGRNERYRLRIPKGHYEVQILDRHDALQTQSTLIRTAVRYYPWLIIMILLFFVIYLWYALHSVEKDFFSQQHIKADDPVWKSFIQTDTPLMVVPGDHYFFTDYFEKYHKDLTVRDVTINSDAEFDSLRNRYPQYDIRPANEPYFPYHSLWSLPPILDVLYSLNKKPILRRSSAVSPQILDEYNFIFVGSIKTLYVLRHTLSQTHFQFSVSPHIITYTPPDSGAPQTYRTNLHSTGPNEDLVLALKLPGPVNNTIFLIASYHSLGAPDIASYLTTPERRIELENLFSKKYGHFPEYFEILFRVIGIDKTAYTTEILVANEIGDSRQ